MVWDGVEVNGFPFGHQGTSGFPPLVDCFVLYVGVVFFFFSMICGRGLLWVGIEKDFFA